MKRKFKRPTKGFFRDKKRKGKDGKPLIRPITSKKKRRIIVKTKFTEEDYLRKWKQRNYTWTSRYLGKVTCPKCGKEGLGHLKIRTNINTGSRVIVGFTIHHPSPVYTLPWRTYCTLTKKQGWKELGDLVPFDFEEKIVKVGAPKGSGKYSKKELKEMSLSRLTHIYHKRCETNDVQGAEEVKKLIKRKYPQYKFRSDRGKYSIEELEKLQTTQLRAIMHNRRARGDIKGAREVEKLILYRLIGKVETFRKAKDFKKFEKIFKRRFQEAKHIFRGMSRDEYEELQRTKRISSADRNSQFTLAFEVAKSWARGDSDVVVRIPKPKNAGPKQYKLNDFYIDELEVLVPNRTFVDKIEKVYDKTMLN